MREHRYDPWKERPPRKAYFREHYQKNRDKKIEAAKARYYENRDEINAKRRKDEGQFT